MSAIFPAACVAPQLPTVEDLLPAAVRIVAPIEGQRIDTRTPTIEIEYTDQRSGIAVVSGRPAWGSLCGRGANPGYS